MVLCMLQLHLNRDQWVSEMKKLFFIIPTIALGGCQTTFTPNQMAQLSCLAATAGGQLASTHASSIKAAQMQADGTTLCTLASGAAVVLTPSK